VFAQAARRLALHRGQDLAGQAWATGKPESVADVVSDPGCQRRGLAAVLGLHGAAALPLVASRTVLGAVTMYSDRHGALDAGALEPLAELGRVLGGFLERKRAESAIVETVESIEDLGVTDPLTGLHNRRGFERVLSSVPSEPYAILAIDVDNLKQVNEQHGQEAGDR